jgi:hypothetical protein
MPSIIMYDVFLEKVLDIKDTKYQHTEDGCMLGCWAM